MSKYLIDLNLDFEDYEKIYSYQVILSFYYGHYYNNTGNIRCDKIDLMNYAIRDLQDYYNHYCKISVTSFSNTPVVALSSSQVVYISTPSVCNNCDTAPNTPPAEAKAVSRL